MVAKMNYGIKKTKPPAPKGGANPTGKPTGKTPTPVVSAASLAKATGGTARLG